MDAGPTFIVVNHLAYVLMACQNEYNIARYAPFARWRASDARKWRAARCHWCERLSNRTLTPHSVGIFVIFVSFPRFIGHIFSVEMIFHWLCFSLSPDNVFRSWNCYYCRSPGISNVSVLTTCVVGYLWLIRKITNPCTKWVGRVKWGSPNVTLHQQVMYCIHLYTVSAQIDAPPPPLLHHCNFECKPEWYSNTRNWCFIL